MAVVGMISLFAVSAAGAPGQVDEFTPTELVQLGVPAGVRFEAGTVKIKNTETIHLQQASVARCGEARWAFLLEFSQAPNFSFHNLALNFDLDNSRETGAAVNSRPGTDLFMTMSKAGVTARYQASEIVVEEAWALSIAQGRTVLVVFEAPGFPASEVNHIRLFSRLRGSGGMKPDTIQSVSFPKAFVQKFSPETEGAGRPALANWGLVHRPERYSAIRDPKDPIKGIVDQSTRQHGIFYISKDDRGLAREHIEVNEARYPRPTPLPEMLARSGEIPATEPLPGELTPFSVLNETAMDRRQSVVRVGVPLPQGRLFTSEGVVLESAEGKMIAAHRAPLSRWEDGSIRALCVDFVDDFAAEEKKTYTLSVSPDGPENRLPEATRPRFCTETATGWRIDTGTAVFHLARGRFGVALEKPGIDKHEPLLPEGMVLEGDDETLYSTVGAPPKRVSVESASGQLVTFRIEGSYVSPAGEEYMSYVTRITFRSGSGRFFLEHTHFNTELSHEFSDFKSLSVPLDLLGPVGSSAVGVVTHDQSIKAAFGSEAMQWEDQQCHLDGADLGKTRMTGAFEAKSESRSLVGWISDAWQRWPKGVHVEGSRVTLNLLPRLPEKFGQELPIYLSFPFVEGGYRMKWGMAFTERFALDFTGGTTLEAASAEAQLPLVPVIPASWYATTRAFGAVAQGASPLGREWDRFFETSFNKHEQRRVSQREYGFLNYGDWFGERARNWGNNEYDTAHAFFVQFMRTGQTAYFRAALAAARHQADVDIVHAYPDPSLVGGNVLHGIGHTGTSSHLVEYGTWSDTFMPSASPNNGHTWTEGLCEAWWLAGDAVCMEAVLKLAENICWVYTPTYESGPSVAPRKAGWILRAISRLYEATADPAYLQAGETIARRAVEHQDAATGAWFWDVPVNWKEIHQKQRKSLPGAQTWQLGILLNGLCCYSYVSGDPEMEQPIRRLAGFLRGSWDKNGGWPYITNTEGGPHPSRPNFNVGMNGILSQGLAFAEVLYPGGEGAAATVEAALMQMFEQHEILAAGQRIGYTLRDAGFTLGLLELAKRQTGGETSSVNTGRHSER